MTALTWLAWIVAQLTRTNPNPRPNAGTPAPTATTTRSRRYEARHAAPRKRDNA